LQYDSAGKNFVVANDIAVGASILTKALTQAEMNNSALTSGYCRWGIRKSGIPDKSS
jgi:hypothetical protein